MEGGAHRRRHRRSAKKRSHRRRHSKSSGLADKSVAQLRRLARSAGVAQSRKGHALKKSALLRALSGKSKRRVHRRKSASKSKRRVHRRKSSSGSKRRVHRKRSHRKH